MNNINTITAQQSVTANINELLDEITDAIRKVSETAKNVNTQSHFRKQITSESLLLINELTERNLHIDESFGNVYRNLDQFIRELSESLSDFRKNVDYFESIKGNINSIKNMLVDIDSQVLIITDIINKVKAGTNDIYMLATNATIVSSKYESMAGVFTILSARLNDMAVFINKNLDNIETDVVRPINNGVKSLKENINTVLKEIDIGNRNFIEFLKMLEEQEEEFSDLVVKAYISGSKIEDQMKMFKEIRDQVIQMDQDALEAISGSDNVRKTGDELEQVIGHVVVAIGEENGREVCIKDLAYLNDKATLIWNTATNVNEKSKSQLQFSYASLDFSDSIIKVSKELKEIVEKFNQQSIQNNALAESIISGISTLTEQLDKLGKYIIGSSKIIKKFSDDYQKASSILGILDNIFKSMNIIGIYSRIEASRDPVEFQGFLTISDNIQKLQENIKKNLPVIKKNIENSDKLIENVNTAFGVISSVFYTIKSSSDNIINKLTQINRTSAEAESISSSILNESLTLDTLLNDLRNYITNLTEVVKIPIEGSAGNIERGKLIEKVSKKILGILNEQSTP